MASYAVCSYNEYMLYNFNNRTFIYYVLIVRLDPESYDYITDKDSLVDHITTYIIQHAECSDSVIFCCLMRAFGPADWPHQSEWSLSMFPMSIETGTMPCIATIINIPHNSIMIYPPMCEDNDDIMVSTSPEEQWCLHLHNISKQNDYTKVR